MRSRGSTEKATAVGDRAWSELVERHHMTVRAMLGRYRGAEQNVAGDGFFAIFDGPARAVKCAQAIVDSVQPLGIQVRAGVHTGEVSTAGEKAAGLAVNIAARVAALAGPSEVLVSHTVKDLVAGSGLRFQDRGSSELKGVEGVWHLYAVEGELARALAAASFNLQLQIGSPEGCWFESNLMMPTAKLKARPCAVRSCREPRPGRIPLRLAVVRAGNLDLSKSKLI